MLLAKLEFIKKFGGLRLLKGWRLCCGWIIDALVTNHASCRRGIASQDTCPICGSAFEAALHVLRDCEVAKDLWKSTGQKVINDSFFQQSLQIWLEHIIFADSHTISRVKWLLLFTTIYSSLWYCKNLVIFKHKNDAHNFLACKALRLAKWEAS